MTALSPIFSRLSENASARAPTGLFLDVRSEGEFKEGRLPGFQSAPILNDDERKAVGICYKKKGQEAAIALALSLTADHRKVRAQEWVSRAKSLGVSEIFVACWRGGLRSEYATEWLKAETDLPVHKIPGGYKALRGELLGLLDRDQEPVVITGFTGARKTELLNTRPEVALDFEAYAHHRGSAFGGFEENPQPAQQTFENRVLFRLHQLFSAERTRFLVEDESIMVGAVTIPSSFKNRMNSAQTIHIEASPEERLSHLADEYAIEPQRAGHSPSEVQEILRRNILKLQKGLGGLRMMETLKLLDEAFSTDPLDLDRHRKWVKPLLLDYYDGHYGKSLKKWNRKILFRGNFQECEEWIQKKFG